MAGFLVPLLLFCIGSVLHTFFNQIFFVLCRGYLQHFFLPAACRVNLSVHNVL